MFSRRLHFILTLFTIRAAAISLSVAAEPLSADKPVPTLTNSVGMRLRLIPAGEFLMGSPASERGRQDDEHLHRVRITKPYYLGMHEVTQGQWRSVMETSPWSGHGNVKEGADYAATWVSWEDATEYCRKLSAKEGKTYRLPTEAEWEYACRAGTTTKYSYGDDDHRMEDYAWWGGFMDDGNANNEQYAHRVGQKRPNPWGLYDMHGNLWEWCSDWYGEKYFVESAKDDPQGPPTGEFRVYRGGGWLAEPATCRSANRNRNMPAYRNSILGFRVTLVP